MPKDDQFTVEVLPNGDLKSVTDPISAPNHSSSEAFFRFMAEVTGGTVQKQRRGTKHVHTHTHEEAGQ